MVWRKIEKTEASPNPSKGGEAGLAEKLKKYLVMGKYGYETANGENYEILKDFAETHRKHPTQAEYALWTRLKAKQLGVRFRQQHIIGNYIADFVSLEKKLIIEVDGGYHSLPEMQISDMQRTCDLNEMGYTILRFNNNEVICNIDNVVKIIKASLSPSKGGEVGRGN